MEKIVTGLLPDRESANRLAADIMGDCRCRRADISMDVRGLASPSRESAVLVTVHAIGPEAAFCVSELMRRHNARGIDARSVPRQARAEETDPGPLWAYSGPDRRGRRQPWSGAERRRS